MSEEKTAILYSKLPQNSKDSLRIVSSANSIADIRQTCETLEVESGNKELNDMQAQAFHFQLLIYMVQDELSLAKYLNKRVSKVVREKDSFKSIWEIGVLMWQNQHSKVYEKIRGGKFQDVFVPFLEKLEVNYRLKQVALVSKAYTSISIEELLGFYLGFKDIKQLIQFIKQNNLSDQWILKDGAKSNKVIINKQKENYQQLLNAQQLMAQFTQYVVFMESNQKLTIDEIASASTSKN